MILPAQNIKNEAEFKDMIVPFEADKKISNGKSYGLSSCSYDLRIAEDLVLGPAVTTQDLLDVMEVAHDGYASMAIKKRLVERPPNSALCSTIERVKIPDMVCGFICDKSSYARVFVTAFNTLFDPGFEGVPTIELVNLGNTTVEYKRGDPVCQMVFHYLFSPTDRPYRGKYQNQPAGAQPAKYEEAPFTPSPL